MNKWTPHYSLDAIKQAVAARKMQCFTFTAMQGIQALGLNDEQALGVIQSLRRRDFYKSMTTHTDHRVWQDVYHAQTQAGPAYVKFTLRQDGAIVISFKAL